jgi:hypothetical protein
VETKHVRLKATGKDPVWWQWKQEERVTAVIRLHIMALFMTWLLLSLVYKVKEMTKLFGRDVPHSTT